MRHAVYDVERLGASFARSLERDDRHLNPAIMSPSNDRSQNRRPWRNDLVVGLDSQLRPTLGTRLNFAALSPAKPEENF